MGRCLRRRLGLFWVVRPRFFLFHVSDIPNTESVQTAKLSFLFVALLDLGLATDRGKLKLPGDVGSVDLSGHASGIAHV